jgi:hypothetical protein
MISRAPAISGTTPTPGYRASSTVGKIAEQRPLRSDRFALARTSLSSAHLEQATPSGAPLSFTSNPGRGCSHRATLRGNPGRA